MTVIFKLGTTEFECDDYLKHHKRLSLHIERRYKDGEVNDLVRKQEFRDNIKANPDKVFTIEVDVYRDGCLEKAMDTRVWLDNISYEEANLPYYSVGASNTKQTTYLRYKFQFEDAVAYLEHSYKSSGSYAMNAASFLDHDFVATMLEEVIEESTLSADGIQDNGDDVTLYIVDKNGEVIDYTTTLSEIEDGFVGVEVYKFEMEIMTPEEMEKRGEL